MLVRSVRGQGIFRWKKHDVFLTKVLWGENVGLLPEDDRWFTIYFAQHPLARFDSQKLCVTPRPETRSQATSGAGDGVSLPSARVHPLRRDDSDLSAIRPFSHVDHWPYRQNIWYIA